MYPRTFLIVTDSGAVTSYTATNITNSIEKSSVFERELLFNTCLNTLQKEYTNEQTSTSS